MISDQQVALKKVQRGGSSHLNRTARQVVPAFLQKLYEMVTDPSNSHLIRWSDSGDSFFVLDHERFAREVLGRWFKHQNFASFVRQLNMYGFHKIPHLQQGVLKSDTDTEYWNFEHPHFHRGQPDMLCLIQRKKQVAQSTDDSAIDIRDAPHTTTATPASHLSAGQLFDINSIVNGITAIKRHQQAISADLNELKNSNELLWQETLASREKYKKQQDTINRILKFLAGVFGNAGNTVHKPNPVDHNPRAMMQRKPTRLMIEQGPGHPGKGVGIVEVEDEDMSSLPPQSPLTEKPSDCSVNSNVQASPPAYLSAISPETPSPMIDETSPGQLTPLSTPLPPQSFVSNERPSMATADTATATIKSQVNRLERAPTPTSLTTASGMTSPDAMQAAFAEMLNSPGQMQRLLAALSAQPNFPISDPMLPPGPDQQQHSSQLTSYDPYHDFSRVFQDDPDLNLNRFAPVDASPSMQLDDVISLPPHDPLVSGTTELQKTYKDAQDIDKDVNALHTSINSLIESLGLDPNLMAASSTQDAIPATEPVIDPGPNMNTSNDADFYFNAFLNDFSGPTDYGDQVDSSAFLDEMSSVSDAATPISLRQESPSISTTTPGRKRKSDAMDLEQTKNSPNLGTKIGKKKK